MEVTASTSRLRIVASVALVMGAVLGMAGTFMPTASLRGLAWGIDGAALVVAGALLTIHHLRCGSELLASGYLVFAIGESLIVSCSAMELAASSPSFSAGVALWSASLMLVSVPRVLPVFVRVLGIAASVLFAIVALRIFAGEPLTPLSSPLPFFAYPFLAATLFGWAWAHLKPVVPITPTCKRL